MGGSLARSGLNDGTTSINGLWSSAKIATELANVSGAYLFQNQCIDYVDNTAAPPTEVTGDRYILDNTGASHANWDGAAAFDIVQFNGTTWDAYTPANGWRCFVTNENQDRAYISSIPAWEPRLNSTAAHLIGGATHIPDTLANLNSKLTDAVLDNQHDLRPADELLTTNGPTLMAIGDIADGQLIQRIGATAVGKTSIFGDHYQRVESFGISSTTSDIFQTKVQLITGALTGTFRIGYGAKAYNDTIPGEIRLYNVTDAVVFGSPHEHTVASGNIDTNGVHTLVLTGASKTIELQFRRAGGPAIKVEYIKDAFIEFWRVI